MFSVRLGTAFKWSPWSEASTRAGRGARGRGVELELVAGLPKADQPWARARISAAWVFEHRPDFSPEHFPNALVAPFFLGVTSNIFSDWGCVPLLGFPLQMFGVSSLGAAPPFLSKYLEAPKHPSSHFPFPVSLQHLVVPLFF